MRALVLPKCIQRWKQHTEASGQGPAKCPICRRAPFTIPTVTETILGRHEEWMLEQKMVRPKDDPKLRPKDQPDSYRFNPRLPKFGVVIKMHKGGDQRFLARSGTVSTTQLSIWITRALTAMTTVSENLWRDTFSSVGIYTPRSWLAINSRAVRRQMSRMDAMKLRPPEAGQQTYDCSKMYTSIRLPELKDKMDKYIDMVFEYQRQAAKPYGQAKHLKIHFSKRHTTLEKQWVSSESAAQCNDSVTTKRVDADRIKVW